MLKQVNGVYGQVIDDLPLVKGDGPLVNCPKIYPSVCPFNGQQVEATTRSAQIVTRAKLGTATLKGFLDNEVQVEVKC